MSTLAIAPDSRVKIRVDAVCHTCKVRHKIKCEPNTFHIHSWEWYAKHDPRTHDVEYYSTDRVLPRGLDERPYEAIDTAPWWLEYKENADIKLAYASSAAITITLASLASSSTFIAGRQSDIVDNKTTVKYLDYRVAGKVTTGASPTAAKSIRILAFGAVDDTPTYPAGLGASDAAASVTVAEQLGAFGFLGTTSVDGTARTYWLGSLQSIAGVFGFVPIRWGLYVAHDTVAALDADAGDHAMSQTGMYVTN